LLVVMLVATPVVARPRVAVAPLDGDDDQKVSEIVADAAGAHAKVTGPKRVSKAIDTLSISTLDKKSVKKLRANLEVDVVIHGAVTKKHLELTLSGKGKQKATLALDFKSTKALKKELAARLGKKLDDVAGPADDSDDDDDDEEARKAKEAEERKKRDEEERKKKDDEEREARRKRDDDDRRRKHGDDDRRRKHDDDDDDRRGKKRVASDDDDDRSVRRRSDDDDDDDRRGKKRRHRRDDDDDLDAPPRNPITQAALWLDAGGAFARRTLTYTATGTMQPPPVGTAAAAAAIEGELYPGAFKTLRGPAARLGVFGDYSYTFGLGIAVPGTTTTAKIKEGHYSIGVRYRVTFGSSSVAFGLAYWRRWYIADRTGLTMPTQLDMPDTDYKAVAPGVVARFAAAPKVGLVVAADIPLMLDAGPIAKSAGYGPADVLAFEVVAGAQIMLAPHAALLLRGDVSQQGFTFAGKAGSMAAARGVTAATDRSLGLTATIGILY
jgi:hypothetical protein